MQERQCRRRQNGQRQREEWRLDQKLGEIVFSSHAMRRSRDLAKGSLWPLMAFWLVILVASIAIGLALDQFASLSDTTLGFFLNALADTASGIVQSIAPVAMYIELRRVKEGTSIDDLAEIFS